MCNVIKLVMAPMGEFPKAIVFIFTLDVKVF